MIEPKTQRVPTQYPPNPMNTGKINSYGYIEPVIAIPQGHNTCWFNASLNMLAMVPSFRTENEKINELLNIIRTGKKTNDEYIKNILAKFLTVRGVYSKMKETELAMQYLKEIQDDEDVTIIIDSSGMDSFELKKFLVLPIEIQKIHANNDIKDTLIFRGEKSVYYYKPIAWTYHWGPAHWGHYYLFYRTDSDILCKINSSPNKITENVELDEESYHFTNGRPLGDQSQNLYTHVLYVRLI